MRIAPQVSCVPAVCARCYMPAASRWHAALAALLEARGGIALPAATTTWPLASVVLAAACGGHVKAGAAHVLR
jgi:hypothetical protein